MSRKFTPVAINLYPESSRLNCLAFALGITSWTYGLSYLEDLNITIEQSFARKIKELGFDTVSLRLVQSLSEVQPDEYVLKVYDFTPLKDSPFSNFHVVRRELDCTWVHKPGWDGIPCIINTEAEWNDLAKEFGEKFILFAIKEEDAV